ncbi:MAG: gliding motility lipoprotein GldH [Paludibacteraceae bacterium]|nr:gliding motility lipoprotein GldH [Paludibacteraceae bacterium]MBR4712491.1 gliding motility lipoprotein GldH [Paludibacteraceae bacterium]
MKGNRILACLFGLVALATSLSSCKDDAFYQASRMIPNEGWCKGDVVSFDFDMVDTASTYNVLVDIRNNNDYPFQNFWLFIHTVMPDSTEFSDTLNCVLADNYGKWIGKASGSMYHVPVAFRLDTKFPQTGRYHFDLIQGMRMDVLPGITEIGVRVLKDGKE